MITPQKEYPHLAAEIGLKSLYFKREDLHPLGSHKGRSIPHMIDLHFAAGIRHFAIASSGNAALAAGLYVKDLNEKKSKKITAGEMAADGAAITLEIFAGKNIAPKKLAKLQALKDDHILVSIQDRPLQILFNKIKDPSVRSLRQSADDDALAGYQSLAEELAEIPDLAAVFIGTSSGTTAQALAQYFLKNAKGEKENSKKTGVEIHVVQTPSCHPMVKALENAVENKEKGNAGPESTTGEISVADAIVDRTAKRAAALVPLIVKTGGGGWITDNESIRIARELTKKHADLDISPNSALSVAGLMNAVYTGRTWKGTVVCMICGE